MQTVGDSMRTRFMLTNGKLILVRRLSVLGCCVLTVCLLVASVSNVSNVHDPNNANAPNNPPQPHKIAESYRAAHPGQSHVDLAAVKSVDEVAVVDLNYDNNDNDKHLIDNAHNKDTINNHKPRLAPPNVPGGGEHDSLNTPPTHNPAPALRVAPVHEFREKVNSLFNGSDTEGDGLGQGHKDNGTVIEHKQVAWIQQDLALNDTQLPLCPRNSPELIGRMSQAVLLIAGLKEQTVTRSHPNVQPGGRWRPKHCRALSRVAVIVPFRDRQSHLNRLLDFLVPMLQRQLLDFTFIVTEQYGHDLFNKGRIMNAAFTLAEKLGVQCVIFHDVDMFPQNDGNYYGCPDSPLHLGAYVNSLGYELWYDYLVGGVLSMRMADYHTVNGFSNSYWAWGGEDDDMGKRIQAMKLPIIRPVKKTGGFTMLKHVKRVRTSTKLIYTLLGEAAERMQTDGLHQQHWRILKVTKRPLYYHIFVDVGKPSTQWYGPGTS